eukprot:3677286-Rhodomonas_salina.2
MAQKLCGNICLCCHHTARPKQAAAALFACLPDGQGKRGDACACLDVRAVLGELIMAGGGGEEGRRGTGCGDDLGGRRDHGVRRTQQHVDACSEPDKESTRADPPQR